MRVSDEVWNEAGRLAHERGITRADLFEKMIENSQVLHGSNEAIKILEEALKLKANAGGAIKKKIREYLKFRGI